MLPHIHIGFLTIPSYALMILVGLLAFVVVTILIVEKKEKAAQRITNRLLILSVFGFAVLALGAFLLNSLFHSIEKGRLILGGITWLGGVICALPVMPLLIHQFCPLVKGEALEYFNFLIPGMVLAHGIGRVGCFLGGCCYGARTDGIFGVSFPEGSLAAKMYPSPGGGSLPVLPTQLFEAVFELLLFLVMLLLYRKLKKHFLETYAIGYGVFRFVLEFFRGDDRGATGFLLTPSQLMSILLILGGVLLILYHRGLIGKKLHAHMRSLKETRDTYDVLSDKDMLRRLRELKMLLDEGVITQAEFETAKRKILGELTEPS